MHKKFVGKGVVVMSVSVEEEPQTKQEQAAVLKFLQSQNAAFTNLILDEPATSWNEKLGFDLRPCVVVFNRKGEWRRFDATELGEKGAEAMVDDFVDTLLKRD